ncbi:DUF2955 domain-containing protein [Vibrio viridaestus]|uniref:DUF2955 domain-containing protein n=1 Tax=Vibrio viridaestus TaxID=2487322 RepID=A0A3N9TLA4_9VIBR|nr:DUF2955 domain-containing protein [Vibrio viridaestus]RQW65060.1 DUF2955 domain-containing protein [Vibrio viridaestus]
MRLWTHPINENDLRQCLRVAVGATLGFIICKVMGWSNGVFYTVTPMLLLGMIPTLSTHIARQLIAAGVVCAIEVGFIAAIFAYHPVLSTIIVFLLFLSKFYCMSKGSLFLFGANSVVSLSIMLHFASYPTTDVNGLVTDNLLANILSVAIAYLVHYFIPDVEPRMPPPGLGAEKQKHRIRHEMLLGAAVTTVSFWAFQIFDLKDSMSAQATSILLLFPMNWNGAMLYARKRALGAILGVSFGIVVQLFLYTWSDQLIFVTLFLWIGILLFGYFHVKEASGSGVGFGGLTTLGILFGQYLSPDQDLTFSALYRIGCIVIAIVITLLFVYLFHLLLNRFSTTQFGE